MKWLHFILSHSIFISFCAVALCYQTYTLLGLPSDNLIYLLVFSSTLCSYNAYWLLSKYYFNRAVSLRKFLGMHFSNALLFFLSSIVVIFCIYFLPGIINFLILAGMLTVFYTLPLWPGKVFKPAARLGFIKTFLLALTWTYVTTVIPTQIKYDDIDAQFLLLFSARFLFMLMLCAIFDSRDSRIDKVRGLKSLATDVSNRTLHAIILSGFVLYIFLGIILRYRFDSLAQTIAFICTGIAVFAVYRYSLKQQGYVFYYFVVDGLMLFSAIAAFVAANV